MVILNLLRIDLNLQIYTDPLHGFILFQELYFFGKKMFHADLEFLWYFSGLTLFKSPL